MRKRRALIIGGSLAGLFAAHLLRAIDWEVEVFERNPGDLAGRGAGIGTHDALIEVAQRIGLSFERAMGVVTHSYTCLDRNGQVLHEMPLQRVMSAWGVIYRPLRDHFPPSATIVALHWRKSLQITTASQRSSPTARAQPAICSSPLTGFAQPCASSIYPTCSHPMPGMSRGAPWFLRTTSRTRSLPRCSIA